MNAHQTSDSVALRHLRDEIVTKWRIRMTIQEVSWLH